MDSDPLPSGGVAGPTNEVPTQITDFSCVTNFEEACADIEAWMRTCAAADGGDGGSAAVLHARDQATQVPWCRTHPFYFPLRQDQAAASAKQPSAADADDVRTVNCVAELFGKLEEAKTDEASEPLLHPIALHFGVSSFLLVRYDGPSSRKAPEASALLSIAATATQQANLAVACFAPASCDDEGGFRGLLHCPAGGKPITGISAPDFHRSLGGAAAAPLPLVRGPASAHHATSAHFRTQTIAMGDLYHSDHGAAPSSTLEGVAELFQLNAGRSTKFIPGDREERTSAAAKQHRTTTPAISANLHKMLQISPPLGEMWDHFTEAELNAIDEVPLGSGRPPPTEPLDRTTPRALFLSAPPETCGRSVPVGTSVAPFRHIEVAVRWLGFDAVSAAVVDNPARSAFCELTDERYGAAAAAQPDATDSSDTRPIPPSAVDVGVSWRAHSEVSSIATDNVRECIHVLSSAFAGTDGDADAAHDGAASLDEENARQQVAREAVYGAEAELPTEARVRHHTKAVFNLPSAADGDSIAAAGAVGVNTLAERFAHECTHLRSCDEMYQLWLSVVDTMQQAFDGGASDAVPPHVASDVPEDLRFRWLADVIGGGKADAPSALLTGTTAVRGIPTTLEAKLDALSTCLRDELADRSRSPPPMSGTAGAAAAAAAPRAGDGWGDGDASMSSARSSAASASSSSHVDEGGHLTDETPASTQPGFALLKHPDVVARLPNARRRAPVTPDEARRHQRELLAAGDSSAARQHRLAAQVEESALLEDMCRFKFANRKAGEESDGAHNVTLADFVRWYSPKDFVGGPDATMPSGDPEGLALLSKRMQSVDVTENAWLAAWNRAAPQALPDLAYSPLAHSKRLLKQLAGETQEDIGTLVASLVPRMAARRLMNARVWRFHRSDTGGTEPVLLELRTMAVGMFRAAVKAVPTDEELSQACTSAAAWCSVFATVLTRIETLDIFTSFVSTAVRMLAGGRADASVDGDCCLLGADGAGKPSGDATRTSPFLQWRFVDRMLASQWRNAPWASQQHQHQQQAAPLASPADNRMATAAVMSARRRIRGLPAVLAGKLQPCEGSLENVPIDVWSAWFGWRLLRPARPPGAAAARRPQRSSSATGVPSLPLRVGGQDVCLGSGVDPDHVILAVKRMELWGYAARPVVKAGDVGQQHTQPPLSLQCMTATFDGEAGVAYYGLGVSESVALF